MASGLTADRRRWHQCYRVVGFPTRHDEEVNRFFLERAMPIGPVDPFSDGIEARIRYYMHTPLVVDLRGGWPRIV